MYGAVRSQVIALVGEAFALSGGKANNVLVTGLVSQITKEVTLRVMMMMVICIYL